jgi:hypothetical protein
MSKHLTEVPRRPSARGVEVPRAVEDALMRCLAKRASDRFDSARDLRKLLEQLLRDNDLGLVETQRLSRELLGEPRPQPPTVPLPVAPPPSMPPRRLATPNDLADELEPGSDGSAGGSAGSQRKRRRRRGLVPILAIGVAVAAGGVAGVLLLWPGRAGYRPSIEIEGATLTAGRRFGPLLVETDGEVSPAEVEAIYARELAALRLHITQQKPALTIPDPVTEIAVMPQAAMCLKRNWNDFDPPKECALSPSVALYGPRGEHRMFVISNRAQLADAIRRGVAQAACELRPPEQTPELKERYRQICELTDQFIQAGVR